MKSLTWGQFAMFLGMGTAIGVAYSIGIRHGRDMHHASAGIVQSIQDAAQSVAMTADIIGSKVADTDNVRTVPVDAAHRIPTPGTTDTPDTAA